MTITIKVDDQFSEDIDLGTPGLSAGDMHLYAASFSNSDGVSGQMSGSCVDVEVEEFQRSLCTEVCEFQRGFVGQIETHGVKPALVPPTPLDVVFSITGGTGDFVGAAGQAVSQPWSSDKVVFRLLSRGPSA